jgi:hypothetical protein
LFELFAKPLIGMELAHIWRGYGSAIFLNFGQLHHRVFKTGRLSNNPVGEMSISLTWSWRVEGKRRIWFGSWSDEERWPIFLNRMIGAKVRAVQLFGRLPEIDLELDCGVHVVSFMTANGDPEWAIHDDRSNPGYYLSVAAGRLKTQSALASEIRVRAADICMLPQERRR